MKRELIIKALIMAFTLAGLMSGCVDVKIKTQIPKDEYYRLGSVDFGSCKTQPMRVRLELDVPQYLNSTNILLLKSSGKIEYLENAKWVDLPLVLFKEALQAQALEKCFFITTIGSESRSIIIRIKEFYITEDSAKIAILYSAFHRQQLLHSKVIKQNIPLADRSKEGRIQAMQVAVDNLIEDIIKQLQSYE